jgi:transcriptional regulator with XRE-family HTH domain
MNSETSFGRWLRQRRKALDLTQEVLADRVGCSISAIRKIENDERRPSRQIASLLAESLEIPPEEREIFIKVARAESRIERLDSFTLTSQPPDPPTRLIPASKTFYPETPTNSEAQGLAHSAMLPVPPTPFVGRQKEMAAINCLLENEQCRLVTLTGPGGIGKTRLAIQVASNQQGNFAEGAYFISLGLLSSAEFIIPTIADGLAFPFSGTREPKAQLLDYLREKEMLVVLDNLEHLVSEAAFLAEILQHAPRVRLLVTSRERLNLQGEWVVEISGLPLQPHDQAFEQTSSVSPIISRSTVQ